MTKAIYLNPNRDGGYDATVGDYYKTLDGDRAVLVVGDGYGGGKTAALKLDNLAALRGCIDDVLTGVR